VPVVQSLDGLAPRFRAALQRVLAEMQRAGFDPAISETTRSDARQRFLFGFGRAYDDGRGVVTNSSDSRRTWHGYGLAADVISASRQWDAPDAFWHGLGAAAHDEGLEWGGAWPSFPDRPHVQWGAPMRRSPSIHADELLRQGGVIAVWHEVGAG
jgi:peptidoglycan LD-endopeptidase CwlK